MLSEAPISEITIQEEYINSETESLSSEEIIEEEKIINITGQLEIKDKKLIIKINKDGRNNKLIEEINKELELLEELKNTYNKNKVINNNEIYKKEIEKIQKELENKYELEVLKNKNKLNIIEENIKENYESKMIILEDKLKDKEESYKIKEINIKENYESKIKILEDKINNIKEEITENNKHQIYYLSKENEKLHEETAQLKKEKDQLYIITNKSSQTKGREGEQDILEYLRTKFEYSNAKIEYVGKDQKYSSDIYLEYDKLKCVIEIKNHASTIQKNDIKKFEEMYIKKEIYNCGIFISLESEYGAMSNRQDFYIKYIEDKPIIYLSNVSKNINKIIFGIKILNYLLENKNENNFELIFNLLKSQISNYSNLHKKLIDMNQILNELILDTKKNKKEIEKIINVKFKEDDEENDELKSNIKNNIHYTKIDAEINNIQCNYCNQKAYSNNSRGITHFIKHLNLKHSINVTKDEINIL
jgi:hypothetical protein